VKGRAGDGNSDDTDAIQAAIDAATAVGGTVFLPKGFYRVSRSINVTARALVPHAPPLLCSKCFNNSFADRSRPQLECRHAHVGWSHRHGQIAVARPALPPPPPRLAAAAAAHGHDVCRDMGASGQRVGNMVAKQASRFIVSARGMMRWPLNPIKWLRSFSQCTQLPPELHLQDNGVFLCKCPPISRRARVLTCRRAGISPPDTSASARVIPHHPLPPPGAACAPPQHHKRRRSGSLLQF